MKKLLAVLCCAALCAAGLSGCLGAPSNARSSRPEDKNTVSASEPAAPSEPAGEGEPAEASGPEDAEDTPPAEGADSGVVGKATVAIKDYFLSKDYEDKDVIIVNFDYTNNGEDAQDFMFAVNVTMYQDGIELESAMVMNEDKFDSQAQMKKIKSGVTLGVQKAYVLNNTTSPVEVEVKELMSFEKNPPVVKKTFTLAE